VSVKVWFSVTIRTSVYILRFHKTYTNTIESNSVTRSQAPCHHCCNVLTNDPASVHPSTGHTTSTIMNWAAEVRTARLGSCHDRISCPHPSFPYRRHLSVFTTHEHTQESKQSTGTSVCVHLHFTFLNLKYTHTCTSIWQTPVVHR
jgi:hypothetical protein